ncbi:hypothetical protein E6O75_ATG04037 [Venturia nashicola]|uniref:Uncharacterized protein n=1 Tax=Venturia nashicola TaxID=86259 RepID=A0A4Z1PPL6_9PEZI|nr:hypothetical protein E6O75_ATG04037 [Venturia nashicola]
MSSLPCLACLSERRAQNPVDSRRQYTVYPVAVYPARSTQHTVDSRQYTVYPVAVYPARSTQHAAPVPSTQHTVPSTQHTVPSTQHTVPNTMAIMSAMRYTPKSQNMLVQLRAAGSSTQRRKRIVAAHRMSSGTEAT